MTIIDDYLEYQEKFEKKFGEKTIVLMEVGSFFEIYGVVNDTEKRGKIYEVADLTNLSISKKCSKTDPVSIKNPLMAGFPNHSIEKWIEILLKHGYHIIKIEQDSHGTKDPKREITEILSPGVNLNTQNFSNNMMSIYFEEYKHSKSGNNILQLGLSIIDVTTGESWVYETYSKPDDYNFALDEVFRFIQSYNPCEILIHTVNSQLTKEKITSYLEISNYQIHYNMYADNKNLLKNKSKQAILKKSFPDTGVLSPIEFIHMERMSFALNSLIYLIQFSYEHNENIINKLLKPRLCEPKNYLVLSHDSINQLNIVPDRNCIDKKGTKSLWDILDKTCTVIGRRFLKDNLLNPLLDTNKLQLRYNLVEELMNEDYISIRKELKNIIDIERLHRKMAMKMMNPYSFVSLDLSYTYVNIIIKKIRELDNKKLLDILPSHKTLASFDEFISEYNDKLIMDKLTGVNLSNIRENIFKEGLYPNIDSIQKNLDFYNLYLEKLCCYLSDLIDPNKKMIDMKFNDRDGHYFNLTKSRMKTLKQKLQQTESKITLDINGKLVDVNLDKIEWKGTSSTSKIFTDTMRNYSQVICGLETKMMKLCLEEFSTLLSDYYNKYSETLIEITSFIGFVDFLCNITFVSKSNGYCKPEIDIRDHSYIDAKNLRHPIIEVIHDKVKYIPNDIKLGIEQQNGVLLYGVNAVGKSSLMKSVGISIVMAQSGFYVPSSSFTYSPFKHVFTRISNNDNIFKGQSTFAVEMAELRSILKRANEFSLVLGDELCSGTETTSGLSIVTAGVLRLCEKSSSFIFATHLHKLSEMDEINECPTVHHYHMETIFEKSTKKLIYDRKLKKGSGNAIYGLEVAKAMDLDDEFIATADKIRKKIMGISEYVVNSKGNPYNSKIIIDCCTICKKETEEIHHIEEQYLANKDGMINHYHKNKLFNLVQLCHECHQNVHNGNLVIDGYVETSNGIELNYKYKEDTTSSDSRKKFNQDHIDIIKDIYDKMKNYKKTKLKLSEQGIDISLSTMKKIIKGTY